MTDSSKTDAAKGMVYIVDDDPASREAVSLLVDEMGVPCQMFESAEHFLNEYNGHRPACLVTDVRMLRMSGLELQEELGRRGTRMATIVLTAYADTAVTVRAIKNGAVTLLEKPCRDLELWDAIRSGLAEDTQNWESDTQRRDLRGRLEQLTPSEQQVLDLLIDGQPNKAIASKLDVSVRTVEVRRQSIYGKLRADSLAELVKLVVEAKQS